MEPHKAHYVSGMMLSAGGNLAGMAASLVTIMAAARLLSKDDMGAFFLVMVVVQCVSLLSDFGLKNTAIKSLSSLPTESVEFIQTARFLLTMTVIMSFIACVGLWPVLLLLKSLWPFESFHEQLAYIAPIAFLAAVLQIATSLLVGAKELRKFAAVSAGIEVLRAIVSTGGLMAGWGVGALLWGMILSRIVGIGAIWVSIPSLFVPAFSHPRKAEFFRFGGWLYGGSLMSVMIVRGSDVILTTYMGTVALAVYTAALQIPTVLQRVFEAMRPALLGYVAAHQDREGAQQIEVIRIVTAALAVAATLLVTVSGPLMVLLYSEKYRDGIPIMQALSVWMAFALVTYLYSVVLIGTGRPKRAFLLTVPQFVGMAVATPLLVPQYGGLGAATALIATAVLGNLAGAKLLAGNDRSMRYVLLSNFVRTAIPLVLFLGIVSLTKVSFFSMVWLGGATLASLIVLKVITTNDIVTVRAAVLGMVGKALARPSPV